MRSRAFRIGAVVVVLALAAAGIFWGRQELYFRQMVGQAEARGVPTTYDELLARYPMPPPEDNAAPLYEEAIAIYGNAPTVPLEKRRDGWEMKDLPEPLGAATVEGPWLSIMKTSAEDFIGHYAEVFALLDAAAARPDCRFVDDFTPGFNLQYHALRQLRRWTELRRFQMLLALHDDRPDDATTAVLQMAPLAKHAIDDPLLPAILEAYIVSGAMVPAMAEYLNLAPLEDATLARIGAAFAEEPGPEVLATAMGNALPAAFSRRGMEEIVGPGTPKISGPVFQIGGALKRIFTGETADLGPLTATGAYATLADWELRMHDAWNTPYPEALDNAEDLAIELGRHPEVFVLTRNMVKGYDMFPPVFATHLAHLRLLRTAIAVERYRLAHGDLPRTLEDGAVAFLGAVPADPFDGQPLRYVPSGTGAYRLYSIGMNRKDEMGADGSGRNGDIVIEISR